MSDIKKPSKAIKTERQQTALYRFYKFTFPGDYPFTICDGGAKEKSIARFKHEKDAETFLEARRERYILTGE